MCSSPEDIKSAVDLLTTADKPLVIVGKGKLACKVTGRFLNFQTQENFAVIYLTLKQKTQP